MIMAALRLTPRQVQVVVLIGRDQLTYDQVALRLRIRPETARYHAEVVRALIGSSRSPRKALAEHYHRHRDELDEGFSA